MKWFLLSFVAVVIVGLLAGCGSDDFHGKYVERASTAVAYCGFARCDGKENR